MTSSHGTVSLTRWALGLIGVAGMLWGVVSLLDDPFDALVSVAIWLAAGVILHDAIMAPLTIGIFLVGTRVLPPPARKPAALAFLVWATCTVTFIAVLSGQGGKPGNETILDRNYAVSYVVLTAALLVATAIVATIRARRGVSAEA